MRTSSPARKGPGGLAIEFENEIFISYAHIDNQPLLEGASGWVSQLHRALEVRASQLMGKHPSIWRDQKLQGNDEFDQTIMERLRRVGVLVSVLTPRYIKSEWCHKELEEFYKAAVLAAGATEQNRARIFKVLKTPVPVAQHPTELQHLLGYEFFKFDPETGKSRELDQAFGPEVQRQFWAKLDDLAQDLCALLSELEGDSAAPCSQRAPAAKGTVYLAETSVDLKDRRDAVRRELLAHGFRVLPDAPLPLNAADLEPYLEQAMARCRLSIHLIGRNFGVVPEGTQQSLGVLQFESALQRKREGAFSALVWIPPGLVTEDARQQGFVDSLRTDTRIQDGADLLETPFEDLNTQIHELLERDEPRPGNAIETSDSPAAHLSVYLLCDRGDTESVAPIADALIEHCEVFLPVFEGDEEAVRADHEANLRNCDGVLIYYGTGGELWLRSQQRDLLKHLGRGRAKPLRATAILVAPPRTPQKDHVRSHEGPVIHLPDPFSPDCLAPFLARLEPKVGSADR